MKSAFGRMERIAKERMSLKETDTIKPQDLVSIKPIVAAIKEFFGSSPALPVHGPGQPPRRAHAQAPPQRPRPRRPLARPRRLRGPRRPLHALRPHVPHRDAGRPEHRPHRLASRPTRRSTSTASSRRPTARSRTARPPSRSSTSPPWTRTSTTSPRRARKIDKTGNFLEKLDLLPAPGRLHDPRRRTSSSTWTSRPSRSSRYPRPSCPSSSTTTPTAPSWARTCSARPCPSSSPSRRASARGWRRSAPTIPGVLAQGAARRRGRLRRRRPHPHQARRRQEGARRVRPRQVPAHQPGYLLHPAPHRQEGREGPQGPGHRRRPGDEGRRARPRAQHPRRLRAVERLQLRGRHPHLRARGQGGHVHLHPHQGIPDRGPRDQARARDA